MPVTVNLSGVEPHCDLVVEEAAIACLETLESLVAWLRVNPLLDETVQAPDRLSPVVD